MKQIPRPEFPRPQFFRCEESFYNLNGEWSYRTDRAEEGEALGFFRNETSFPETIVVPFCRESVLSGIGDTGFCNGCWYRRTVTLPEAASGKRVLLHIDASDYLTRVWVNERLVGSHEGGYTPMTFDITEEILAGENVLTIGVKDDVRSGRQPAGKQSDREKSFDCSYTRTTGIWQTVWLEFVPFSYIKHVLYTPDIDRGSLTVETDIVGGEGATLKALAFYEGKPVGEDSVTVHGGKARLVLSLAELHLWEVGQGRLYDLLLTMGEDRVESYFGMRKVEAREGLLYLNGKPVFQRLVLDQGFYPDGIWTAPSDEALLGDIERSIAMGFNGARLHQKVFEERFLYHCDRLGYIVWGEDGNWGINLARPEAWANYLPEWLEIVERDFNHPAIVGWCPINETQKDQDPEFVRFLAKLTRAADPTRLYIEASGWRHIEGLADMIDTHDYCQDPVEFAAKFEPLKEGKPIPIFLFKHWNMEEITYPTFVSEYGGIRWADENDQKAWGYGNAPKTGEEFIERFKGLTEALLFHPKMGALCYTQLTDVEQEQNGL